MCVGGAAVWQVCWANCHSSHQSFIDLVVSFRLAPAAILVVRVVPSGGMCGLVDSVVSGV